MRNRSVIALTPRTSKWSSVASKWEQMFFYSCHDGAGVYLAELLNSADSDDFTGTGSTLWGQAGFGVVPDGDGGFPLPKAVNAAFYWDTPMVFGVSVFLSMYDVGVAGGSQETVISAGSDATAEANEPAAGHWRFRIATTGTQINPVHMYRDGVDTDADGSTPTVNSVTVATAAITSGSYAERACFQMLIQYDGADLSWTLYRDGASSDSGTYTIDGTQRLNLMRSRESLLDGVVRIGSNINGLEPSVAERAGWEAGSAATGMSIENVCIFRSTTKTAAQALAILQKLYKFRGEAPV